MFIMIVNYNLSIQNIIIQGNTMPDYQKLYTFMFNAGTDALRALENLDIGQAKKIICEAQRQAEERYISDGRK